MLSSRVASSSNSFGAKSAVCCRMSEAPAPVLGSEEEATELDVPEVKINKFYLYQIKIHVY